MPPVARPDSTWWMSRLRFTSVAEVRAPDRLVVADRLGGPRHDDAAGLEQIGAVGQLERERRVLLDKQHADAVALVDGAKDLEQLLHDQRRQSERRLVE